MKRFIALLFCGYVLYGQSLSLVHFSGVDVGSSTTTVKGQLSSPATAGNVLVVAATFTPQTSTNAISSVCDSTSSATCSTSLSTWHILASTKGCNSASNGACAEIAVSCSIGSGSDYITVTLADTATNGNGLMAWEISSTTGWQSVCYDQQTDGVATSSPVTTGSFTTGQAIEALVAAWADDQNCNSGWSATPSTWTLNAAVSCSSISQQGFYQFVSAIQSAATLKVAFTSPTSDSSVLSLVTLEPLSSGGFTSEAVKRKKYCFFGDCE